MMSRFGSGMSVPAHILLRMVCLSSVNFETMVT